MLPRSIYAIEIMTGFKLLDDPVKSLGGSRIGPVSHFGANDPPGRT